MNSLQLFNNKKETSLLIILLIFLAFFNYFHEYFKYKEFKTEEIYSGTFQIVNIYKKDDFFVVKLQNSNFSFFTSLELLENLHKLDYIDITFVTLNIEFIDYLKGFYSKSIYHEEPFSKPSIKTILYDKINQIHKNSKISELFAALFLAIPVSKQSREFYTNWGISHLIAISGFHLAILLFISYWFIYLIYFQIHKKYFIYRNIKFDLLLISSIFAFFYLYLTDLVPSLLRSFVMFLLGILFLRANIKLLSFKTLFLTLLLILAIFPKFLFSISLWFSIAGVFYIFLYIKYFNNFPKILSIIFFNFWIFFVFNPVVHFFFYNTTYEQLLSPLLTILFTIFYPLELFLHLLGFGDILNDYIVILFDYKFIIFEKESKLFFFIFYILCSILSIFSKKFFIILNLLLLIFNINIYI
ncbi:competence protein [Halarcobacter ebronensis]|uniref:Competence protein n=1 Tax=Halarcobacter ebronensis TaxID=1462615 RepID=A0A4Q0YHG5_9BACT|nr:ComEC/Rec2 family competence protein [Halarcobacter ebronensis]RXJ70077.1 competence protein [Halarcobacter ebronensis]